MKEISEGSGRAILVAAVVGAAVGAGVALLYAPCSGKETRGWLAHRTRVIKGKTSNVVEHGKEAVRRVAKELASDGDDPENGHKRSASSKSVAATARG
jgi:gas vesicle protein